MEEATSDTKTSGTRPRYWQVNMPVDEWTEECPDFLKGLPKKDVDILSMTDTEFLENGLTMDWAEVKDIVKNGRLERFRRLPSHLRRYKAFRYGLRESYGGVMPFILQTRLRWTQPVTPRGAPFQFAEDFKILFNDWPYGTSSDIVHLVVWTKFTLEEDPQTTVLTERGRTQVEEFVTREFRTKLPEGHVRND